MQRESRKTVGASIGVAVNREGKQCKTFRAMKKKRARKTCPRNNRKELRFFFDMNLDLRGDVAEDLHGDRELAERLQRFSKLDLPLVD